VIAISFEQTNGAHQEIPERGIGTFTPASKEIVAAAVSGPYADEK
jgi:hypothetical protein